MLFAQRVLRGLRAFPEICWERNLSCGFARTGCVGRSWSSEQALERTVSDPVTRNIWRSAKRYERKQSKLRIRGREGKRKDRSEAKKGNDFDETPPTQ